MRDNVGPRTISWIGNLHGMAPHFITDLAEAIHAPLHITQITEVVKSDNWVNPVENAP